MSGHSKWSTIKHKKAAKDAKRGALFTRLIKDIQVAARLGGSDLTSNARLRIAVQKAKDNNMPAENIDRAIKKGAGELEGVSYEEYIYEGYGPGGVAFMVIVLTDNRNRTSADVRTVFSKNGGSLAEAGAVSYLFERKGIINVSKDKASEEELMEMVMEQGAEDIRDEGDNFQITTPPESFMNVINALEANNLSAQEAEVRYIAQNEIEVDEKVAEQSLNLMEKLEDLDDVQNVYANFDISDEVMSALANRS
jgi:YebC/PmpR family DNA-binding regulatory protein